MSTMRNIKPGGLLASVVLGLAFTPQVWAADLGVDYGEEITNDVSIDYQVGTSEQTQILASASGGDDSFFVDIAIDMTLTEQDGASVQIAPGGSAETEFLLHNLTNGTMYFRFTAANNDGTAFDTAVDETGGAMDVSNFSLASDSDGSCADALNRTPITLITGVVTLTEDEQLTLCLSADAPALGEVDGDIAVIELIAIATDSDGDVDFDDANDGSAVNATGIGATGFAAEDDDVLYVLAEDVGNVKANLTEDPTTTGTNQDGDGEVGDTSAYILANADLFITKTSAVISDPLGQNTYEIPGSVIEYTIVIENTGSADAEDVYLVDALDTVNTTFVDDSPAIESFGTGENAGNGQDGICEGASGGTTTYLETAGDASVDNGADGVLYDDTNDELEFFADEDDALTVPADSCIEVRYRVTIN